MGFNCIFLKRRACAYGSFFLLQCAAGASAAQSTASADFRGAAVEMPAMFVTASRAPQPFATLLADVTVVDAEAIARSGADSLTELLQRQPGIEIVQNGGPGSTSGMFLRGSNSNQTLILVDGMRVSSSSTGTTALEAIPLAQIDHIEILRGPASSLYGSDAIGGVVQVFTRKGGDELQANASAGYGTYDTRQAQAGINGGNGMFHGAVQFGATASHGYDAIVNPGNLSYDPDADGYRSNSVSANARLGWAQGQSLGAQYFRSRLNAQFDGGDAYNDRTITTLQSYAVNSDNALTAGWTSRLSAGTGSDNSVSQTGYGAYPFLTRQHQYAWQNEFDVAPSLSQWGVTRAQATLGFERREEDVTTDDAFAVTSRDTNAIFGAWQMSAGAHALQANLRHDDSTQFGNRTTGAVAYGYRFSPAWRASASYGTAFKAPSFNDLYFPGYSNPDLVPEQSKNLEGGVYWKGTGGAATLDASLVAYRNKISDMIVFQCDADFNCVPQNVEHATLTGATLSASAGFGATTLRASLDVGSPRDDDNGHLLPRRAYVHASAAASQQAGAWRFGAELVASGYRYDDAANLRQMGGYTVLNLTAQWSLAKDFALFLRADNVFDKDYELAADYSTGGAQWFAGVRWAL